MQAAKTAPLFEKGYMRIKQCRHGPMLYNINDRVIGRNLDLYGEWGEPELTLLDQFLEMGDVVLDVGANIGTHTLFFAQKIAPSGMVWAFEPQRVSFQILCGNMALNSLPNVQALNVAVSDQTGQVIVPNLDPTQNYNFGGLSLKDQTQGQRMPVITIDSLELPKCSLIKVDVEGAELQVLQGAAKTVEAHQPILFVENHLLPESEPLLKWILERKYRCWWQLQGFSPDNFFQSDVDISNGYIEANVLCLPESVDPEDYDLEKLIPVLGANDTWKDAQKRS